MPTPEEVPLVSSLEDNLAHLRSLAESNNLVWVGSRADDGALGRLVVYAKGEYASAILKFLESSPELDAICKRQG